MYFERIAEIIAEQLGRVAGEIEPDTAIESLGGDSLDLVEIIMAIEDEYAIEFEEEMTFETVRELVTYVEQRQA